MRSLWATNCVGSTDVTGTAEAMLVPRMLSGLPSPALLISLLLSHSRETLSIDHSLHHLWPPSGHRGACVRAPGWAKPYLSPSLISTGRHPSPRSSVHHSDSTDSTVHSDRGRGRDNGQLFVCLHSEEPPAPVGGGIGGARRRQHQVAVVLMKALERRRRGRPRPIRESSIIAPLILFVLLF